MATFNVSRCFLRGYPVSARIVASTAARASQLQASMIRTPAGLGVKSTTALALQAADATFRQPLALYATSASATPKKKLKKVNITFIDRDGDEHSVKAKVGDTLLEVAKEFDIDLEGACEGTLSCSTCHLIINPEWYEKIPDPLTEEEQDMLDLAYGLTDTSRLGCQIIVSEKLEGLKLTVPAVTKDIRNL